MYGFFAGKKASVRDSYNADIESKQSAKRQRYQEDVEENRAAKRPKYEDNSAAIKASERNRYWYDPAVRLAKRAAERKRYRVHILLKCESGCKILAF